MRKPPAIRGACTALVLAAILSAAPPARAAGGNRIIARVNDRIATLYDYEIRLEEALRRADDLPADVGDRQEYLTELARDVMREIFEELLILSRADQLAVTVTAIEVTEAINKMRESNGLLDDEQFRQALAQSGLTQEQLRSQFEQQMRFQRVVGREVYSEVTMEEEDLRRYYRDHIEEFRQPEQVQLREVVVLDDTGASAAAMSLAAGLAAELAAGKPLEDAVAALSPGTVSATIELGWVESGDLDAALEDAVWDLGPGSWSEPTRGRGGVHLAQVIERKESVIPAFKDVEAEIRQREERSRVNARLKDYLAELEKKSYLYLDPPPEAAGFRSAAGETPLNVEFPLIAAGTSAEDAGGKKGSKGAGAKAAAGQGAAAPEGSTAGAAPEAGAGEPGAAAEAAEERAVEGELRQAPAEEIDLRPDSEEDSEEEDPDEDSEADPEGDSDTEAGAEPAPPPAQA